MSSSFSTALSGMNADTQAINVVGNNLANLNTVGFKDSSVSFSELVAQSLGAGGDDQQVGNGIANVYTTRNFTQGSIETTQGAFDAAINGNGFFVLNNTSGQQLYTRAGNFEVSKDGYLITQDGENVEGWNAVNGVLNPSGSTSDIQIPSSDNQKAVATSTLSVALNLNSTAAVGDSSGTFSTPVQIYDSTGASHTVTLTFTKTDANTWQYDATVPGQDMAGGTSGTPVDLAKGTLTFNSDGSLNLSSTGSGSGTSSTSIDLKPSDSSITGFSNGASFSSISWQLAGSDGTPLLTQYAEDSATGSITQDGSAPATLETVSLGDNGTVVAHYSTGKDVTIAQLAVASIQNPDTLVDVGNNNFATGTATVQAAIGTAGTSGRGTIKAGAIEGSTVDVATELTNLMVFQRGYEANSKVITTVDQLTQDAVNLIR